MAGVRIGRDEIEHAAGRFGARLRGSPPSRRSPLGRAPFPHWEGAVGRRLGSLRAAAAPTLRSSEEQT